MKINIIDLPELTNRILLPGNSDDQRYYLNEINRLFSYLKSPEGTEIYKEYTYNDDDTMVIISNREKYRLIFYVVGITK